MSMGQRVRVGRRLLLCSELEGGERREEGSGEARVGRVGWGLKEVGWCYFCSVLVEMAARLFFGKGQIALWQGGDDKRQLTELLLGSARGHRGDGSPISLRRVAVRDFGSGRCDVNGKGVVHVRRSCDEKLRCMIFM